MTHNFKTSREAHNCLEKIMKRECEKATKVNYGLPIVSDTVLHIANAKEFQWLLQPELKAIKDGLIYVEDKDCVKWGWDGKYRGYINEKGQKQGVGIFMNRNSAKWIGEWLEDELHRTAKQEFSGGSSDWGK